MRMLSWDRLRRVRLSPAGGSAGGSLPGRGALRGHGKRVGAAGVIVAGVVALGGCSVIPPLTIEQVPLPAPGGMGSSYSISGVFSNVLNLPAQAKVRFNGADVGEVTDIKVHNYQATIKMKISRSTVLPVGSWGELRQATPLGDVFVALNIPDTNGVNRGNLRNGDSLQAQCPPANEPQTCDQAAASVEDVMTTAAAFLNGGLFGNAQTLVKELNTGLSGHEDDITTILSGAQLAVNRLRLNTTEIDGSIDSVDRVTSLLAQNRDSIAAAINVLGPALQTIDGQMDQIVNLTTKVQPIIRSVQDYFDTSTPALRDAVVNTDTLVQALNRTTYLLGPLADRLHVLTPKAQRSVKGPAVAVSLGVWYLTPGFGFDEGSRLPEVSDIPQTASSLYQTLLRLFARLTATHGADQ